jgi:rubrerythrin
MDLRFECPQVASSFGSSQFVGGPELIFLREDIADELGAIVGYLECAGQIKDYRINEHFRKIANDENEHFIRLTSMLAILDPVQAGEFKRQGLSKLNSLSEPVNSFGIPGQCQTCAQVERYRYDLDEKRPYTPDERILECLQNAIRDELHAINAYQKQIMATTNPTVQNLLTTIMNKEKEHVSGFMKLFYNVYRV